ncbi:HAMP domain-containing protein [Ancylobacter dichloromethanicus]|uniref:sensor histidine kinase n=1 Tax=Ancylobacter dichloromethanicus TaxID=518825 RepID=UPI001BCC118B|nr:ATP-binding protein [Ancylobacter dichloromethanicus]MBS7556174.1 HAMP domain-containing protein [Ancylobacter dichloromethanicus]
MTALGKLFRTTAFKLLAAYLVVFAVFAGSVIAYLGWHTQRLVTRQAVEAIENDTRFMQAQFERGGITRLVQLVNRRARAPDAGLLLITSFNGDPLGGNVLNLPLNFLDRQGWREIDYLRSEDASAAPSRALVHVIFLPGEYRLLIGRDVVEREELRQIIIGPAVWGLALLVVLGMAGGLFITRRVLKRIDQMTAISDGIMAGDLSGRLAISGAGDEFDRLALSLNAMLDRIEALMAGLKEVSDNIAHDLKTPLTRLRNRAEDALRTAQSEEEWRLATERTIEESDGLIRTFDALLMIARAEAGQASAKMLRFDLAATVAGVAELYEPVADESGLDLRAEVAGPLPMHGVRELFEQALANLIDNAIKYSAPEIHEGEPGERRDITLTARREGERLRLVVADRGPGIPEADRPRALERFVRLEASRTRPGFGLGLSLVAAVVRLHGGTLSLEGNDPGLRIVIDLPLDLSDEVGAD